MFLTVSLMWLGEALTIISQLLAAKYNQTQAVFPYLLITVGGIILIITYKIGIAQTGSIWIVTVISLTSILVLEPAIIYFLFRELPSKGALWGFLFGTIGLGMTLFYE